MLSYNELVQCAAMLILISVLLGAMTVVMAVHGGILASAEGKHKRWFVIYGLIAFILLIMQGILIHRQDTANHTDMVSLRKVVDNLRDQVNTLNNALKIQISVDDFHRLEAAITNGFATIKEICQGGRKPGKPAEQPKPALPPAVVEHIRIIQRRAASENPKAQYGLQVVMQSDVTAQPVAFKVECDHEITDGKAFIIGQGAYMMYATAFSSDRKAFMFSFKYPPLTPDSSLVVSLTSSYDIRVTKVEKIQPLF